MNHKEYNGWWNYETWIVHNLWVDGDHGDQEFWHKEAEHAYNNSKTDNILTKAMRARFDLAKTLKISIEEGNPITKPSIYSDLMDGAISEVNFQEIAGHLIDAILENEEVK